MTWTRNSFRARRTPGPTFANTYGCTICKRRRQELFPANKWENFEGMKEVGRKFKETVCGPPSKLTFHWIHTGGISLRLRRQNEQ